ncbi:hypothetical protein [Oceanospirillum sp.]|uniref:hypothetical protein n=1 Tax=Oceanospirillum sp. TaxID=2021254 RepID=UPI003A94A411
MSDNLNLTLTLRATDRGLTGTVREARDGVGQLDDQLGKTSQSTRQFAKHTRDADKSTGGFAKRMAGGAVGAAQWALALGTAATAMTGYIVATNTDAIRQTDMFAQSLNMSTQTMTEWQYASEQMGLSGDGLQQVFQDVQDKLGDLTTTGGGEAVDLFENLNLQMDELITLSPDKQLLSIADAMDGINQNQKVFFMESLASDSTRLLPLLQDNAAELRRLQLEAQVLGVSISDIDAAKVTQAGRAMDRTKGLMGGLANEITIELAPVLTGVSNLLVDNAVEAGGFGDAVRTTVDGAVTGIGFVLDVGQQLLVWSKHAQIGMMTLGQYGTGAMASIADTTAAVINLSLYPFQQTIAWIIEQVSSLVELGSRFGGPFADSFKDASEWLGTFSNEVKQFEVQGADIVALNERMLAGLSTAATELDALINANAPSEDLKNWVQKLREESEQAAQAQVDLRNETGKTGDVVGAGVDVSPYEKLTAELESQLELVGLSARELAIETQIRKLSAQATDEQKDAIRRLAGELFDAQEQQKGTQTTLETGLVTLTALTEQAAERIDGAFADAWANIGDGFDGLADGIQGAFTQMLAEMAHEALTKPIILNVQQSMGEAGAASSASAGGSASGAGLAGGVGIAGGAFAAAALVTVAAINAHNKADAERMKKYTAEYRQGVQSTGTVLGDINAKSHSVSELTAELVEMNTDVLGVNFDMLDSLRAIESGIAGVSTGISRQLTQAGGLEDYAGSKSTSEYFDTTIGLGGMMSGSTKILDAAGLGIVGDFVDGLVGTISSAIYSKKKSLQDAGIDFAEQTLGAVIDDGFVSADAYQRVKTTRSVLGIKSSSSSKNTLDLDDSIQYQLGDVFSNAASVLADVGGELDLNLQTLKKEIVVGTSEVIETWGNFSRTTLEDQTELVGTSMDNFIRSLSIDASELSLKGLKGDELSAEIEAYISSNLDTWASQMLDAADLSGWVEQYQQAGEGVFQTLGRLTAQSRSFQATASQLNLQFEASGLESVELTQSLAGLAGGFDQLQSQTSAYYSNYFSSAEQQAYLQQQLTAAFAEYNAELPKSKAEYRALVESLDLTSASGQQAYTRLMQLQGSFSDYVDEMESAGMKLQALIGASQSESLGGYLQNLADWSADELSRIEQDYQERIALAEEQFRIGRELRQYVEQLKISELSPYDPSEKLELATEQFAALLVKAEAGDMDAAGQLQSTANSYLQNADSYYGRSDPYTAIFEDVSQSLDSLGLDIMGGLDEDSVEKLTAQMLSEQQRIRDYAREQLDWTVSQYDALTSISQLLELLPESLASQLGSITGAAASSSATESLLLSQWDQMGGGAYSNTDLSSYAAAIDSGAVDRSAINADLAYYQQNQSAAMQQVLDLWEATGGGSYNDADLSRYAADIAAGKGTLSVADLEHYRATHGSHAKGLNSVPFDGYRAELHQSEMVLTADVADHIRQSMRVGVSQSPQVIVQTDPALIAELQQLRSEVAQLRAERAQSASKAEQQRTAQTDATETLVRTNRTPVKIP